MIPAVPVLRARITLLLGLLFLVPFCAVGVFLAPLAFETLSAGETENGLLLGIASLLFGGAGFGLLALLLVRMRRQREVDRLKARNPDEPWRWREDWAAGHVRLASTSRLTTIWFFAIFWNLLSLPLLLFLPAEVFERGNAPAALGFLFPLVGAGLLVAAVRGSVARAVHGQSALHLDTVPGVVGGMLEGKVCLDGVLQPSEGFTLRLSCIRRTIRGSGKNRSTSESIEWQDERTGVSPVPRPDSPGTALPVSFQIPYECPPHSAEEGGEGIFWRLDVKASVPGVDYAAEFDVPVFKTARSSPALTEDRLKSDARQRGEALPVRPAESGVIVRPSPQGGTEFVILPGRNRGPGLSIALFALVWTGILWVLVALGAPVIFPVVFGLFDLLFLYAAAQFLFAEYRIIVEEGDVSVRQILFGLMTGQRIPCRDIAGVRVAIGAQSGSGVYRGLEILRKDGRKVKAGGLLKDKNLADWLATELQRSIAQGDRTP